MCQYRGENGMYLYMSAETCRDVDRNDFGGLGSVELQGVISRVK